ncbi:hypothetical protein NIES2101_43685 [Calothrix sp. HK-06]|nr:hypothetical protein NIES2101_43685 [Calothrix sp. HK-06]
MSQKLLLIIMTASLYLAVSELSTSVVLAQNNTQPSKPGSSPEIIEQQLPELVGQWSIKDFSPFNVSVVFTPEKKLYVLPLFSPWFGGTFGGSFDKPSAYEIPYKINSSTKPMQIDLIFGSEAENIKTIFETTPEGKIRLELIGLRPGEPRPTEFTTGSILIEKVSNLTKLPRNTQVINVVQERKKSAQSEGKTYLGSMLRGQQAYFLENDKFSSNLNDLQLGIKSETESYSFRVIPQGNQKQQVMMTVTAKKPELNSYTGVVYVVKNKQELLTMTAICETEKPSMNAPAKPKIPNKLSGKVQCPAGSRSS